MERSTVRVFCERMIGWLFITLLVGLPCIAIATYVLCVESIQLDFASDRIVCQYELISDARYVATSPSLGSIGIRFLPGAAPGVGPRELVVKTRWILYCITGLIGCGLISLLIHQRKKAKAAADPVRSEEEGIDKTSLCRPRFQFSLRTFLIVALLLGAVLPASLYRARSVLQRRRTLSMGYVAMSRDFTDTQTLSAKRHVVPGSLWQSLTYVPNAVWRKPPRFGIVAPKSGTQNYQVILINPMVNRDQLVIVEAKLGSGASGCSLDLFPADVNLRGSAEEQNNVRVQHSKLSLYDLYPKGEGVMLFPIKPGQSYQLGVTGNWGLPNSKNEVELTIRVGDY